MTTVSKIEAHPTKAPAIMYPVVSYELDEAAKASGFSPKALRDAITAGDLIAHRASNARNSKLVIRPADLDAYIESLPFAGDYRNKTA